LNTYHIPQQTAATSQRYHHHCHINHHDNDNDEDDNLKDKRDDIDNGLEMQPLLGDLFHFSGMFFFIVF
jgi:hypothetical protein